MLNIFWDAEKKIEGNLSGALRDVASWLNERTTAVGTRFGEAISRLEDLTTAVREVAANVDSVHSSMLNVEAHLRVIPSGVRDAVKESVDDAAVDAMRKELAKLTRENATLQRQLREKETPTNDVGTDSEEAAGAAGHGGGSEAVEEPPSEAAQAGGGDDSEGSGRQDDRHQGPGRSAGTSPGAE
jgi:hypothetical protein